MRRIVFVEVSFAKSDVYVWYSLEVDLAVESQKHRWNPTGGRFEDGKLTSEFGGRQDGDEDIVQSAV